MAAGKGDHIEPVNQKSEAAAAAHKDTGENLLKDARKDVITPSEKVHPKEAAHIAGVEGVQKACDNAGQCAKTLEANKQDSDAAFKATLTAKPGTLDLALQHAAILIAKNEMPADPNKWTAAHHDRLAQLATATA